jgi:hypothetical protein
MRPVPTALVVSTLLAAGPAGATFIGDDAYREVRAGLPTADLESLTGLGPFDEAVVFAESSECGSASSQANQDSMIGLRAITGTLGDSVSVGGCLGGFASATLTASFQLEAGESVAVIASLIPFYADFYAGSASFTIHEDGGAQVVGAFAVAEPVGFFWYLDMSEVL